MDVKQLIEEINAAGENLSKTSVNKSKLSTAYCRKASKTLDKITNKPDYNEVITGLWFVTVHLSEHIVHLKPVGAFSELCLKLFRQCAKAILNIQWEKLEDGSLRHNFLTSLTKLHTKLVPLNITRFHLLESLSENPWTHPTLAKVMGGELDDSNKEEVQCYIRNEDPIILQLRVDMMLKENCEEYALNLCNSYLGHPDLKSDLSVRKTQFYLLYKLGQEDKLQEECQKMSIKDAVNVIKQLQTSKTHRKMCTVLAQTFMVQNWIRPSDMEASKELLRLWIMHQLLVDKEQDQFKESVWAMAKLSQSTDQIIVFIDVLREACGETFLQLYVDMCIFAINVDKGQMEVSIKEGNKEAAAARGSDMSSVCAKLSCLCHQTSIKLARMCALTAFALKPAEQSYAKIGAFYDQGSNCCDKCGQDQKHKQGTINPATLYEVERLLNMLRPEYLSPSHSYADTQVLCHKYLLESLTNIGKLYHTTPSTSESIKDVHNTAVPGNNNAETTVSPSAALFENLSSQDIQNIKILLSRINLDNITNAATTALPNSTPRLAIHLQETNTSFIEQHNQSSEMSKIQHINKSCEPVEQQINHKIDPQEQHGKEELTINNMNLQMEKKTPGFVEKQPDHKKQVQEIITAALKQDSTTVGRLVQTASPELLQAVFSVIKVAIGKPSITASNQQQQINSQQINNPQQINLMHSSSKLAEQQLPNVSTLFHPSLQLKQQQKLPHHLDRQHTMQQLPQEQPLKPQQHVQTLTLSTVKKSTPVNIQATSTALPNKIHITPNHPLLTVNCKNLIASNTALLSNTLPPTTVAMTSASAEEQQKTQTFLLAKSRVEDIRHFLQMQMSNFQQKQITEPWQMSGAVVTLNSDSTVISDRPQFILTNKQPAAYEIIKPASLGKTQEQEVFRQNRLQQLPQMLMRQKLTSQAEQKLIKQGQQLSQNPGDMVYTNLTLQPLSSENQQQQNSTPCFEGYQSIAVTPKSSFVSSNANIINSKLIQPVIAQKIQNSSKPQVHGIFTSNSNTSHFSVPQTLQANSVTSIRNQPQKIIAISNLPSSHFQSSTVTGVSKCSALYVTSHTLNSINTISQSALNWKPPTTTSFQHSMPRNYVPNSQELQSNKITVSIKLPDNEMMLPKVETAQEVTKIDAGKVDKDSAIYRCILCSIAFKTLENLQAHVKTVCRPGRLPSSMYSTKFRQDKTAAANSGMETTTVFQCLRCFELCISNAGIKQHRQICKKVQLPSGLKMDGVNTEESIAPKITVGRQTIIVKDILGNQPGEAELKTNSDNRSVNCELNNSYASQSVKNELNVNSNSQSVTDMLIDNSPNQSTIRELNDSFVDSSVVQGQNNNCVNQLVLSELTEDSSRKLMNEELINSHKQFMSGELKDNSQTGEFTTPFLVLPQAATSSSVRTTTHESSTHQPCSIIHSIGLNSQSLQPNGNTVGKADTLPTIHQNFTHQVNVISPKNWLTSSVPITNLAHTPQTITTLLNKTTSLQIPCTTACLNSSSISANMDTITLEPVHKSIHNDPLSFAYANGTNNSADNSTEERSMTCCIIGKNETSVTKAEPDFESEEMIITMKDAKLSKKNQSCEICQISCRNKRSLLLHFVRKHLKSYTFNKSLGSSTYLCHFCQNTFSKFQLFLQHVLSHSVAINRKMKTFTANRKLCQNSKIVASQSELTLKVNAKMINTKTMSKSIINKLKKQLAQKRLKKISQRKRHFMSRCESVHDNIDASDSSALLRSHQSGVHVNSGHKLTMIRQGSAEGREPNKSFSQECKRSIQLPLYQLLKDNNQELSGGCIHEESSRSFVINDKGADDLPVTRRYSFEKKLQSSNFKKRKSHSPSDADTQSKEIRKNSNISDSNSDSKSYDLQLSNYGNSMQVSKIATTNVCGHSNMAEERVSGQQFESSRTLFNKSPSKQQKECPQSCNLNQNVLNVLNPKNSEVICQIGNSPAVSTENQQSLNMKEKTKSSKLHESTLSPDLSASSSTQIRTPSSFLDSYLSYLSQYPLSEIHNRAKNRYKSCVSNTQRLQVATNRLDSTHLGGQSETSPSEKNQISVGQSEVPCAKSQISVEQCEVPCDKNQISVEQCEVPCDKNQISVEQCEVPCDKNQISVEQCEVPCDKNQISVEQCEVPCDKNQISVEQCEVPCDKNQISVEQCEVPCDKNQISVEQCEVPCEKNQISEQCSTILLHSNANQKDYLIKSIEQEESAQNNVLHFQEKKCDNFQNNHSECCFINVGHNLGPEDVSSYRNSLAAPDISLISLPTNHVEQDKTHLSALSSESLLTDTKMEQESTSSTESEKFDASMDISTSLITESVSKDEEFSFSNDTGLQVAVIPVANEEDDNLRYIDHGSEGIINAGWREGFVKIEVKSNSDVMVTDDRCNEEVNTTGEKITTEDYDSIKCDLSLLGCSGKEKEGNDQIIQDRVMEVNIQMQTYMHNGDDNMKYKEKDDIKFNEIINKSVEPVARVEKTSKAKQVDSGNVHCQQIVRTDLKYERVDRDPTYGDIIIESSKCEDTIRESSKCEDTMREFLKCEDTMRESSKSEDTMRESSKSEDTIRESSKYEDTMRESSKCEDTMREFLKCEDTMRESSKSEDTMRESSKSEDTIRESSKYEDTMRESSKCEDTMRESSKCEQLGRDHKLCEPLYEEDLTYKQLDTEVKSGQVEICIFSKENQAQLHQNTCMKPGKKSWSSSDNEITGQCLNKSPYTQVTRGISFRETSHITSQFLEADITLQPYSLNNLNGNSLNNGDNLINGKKNNVKDNHENDFSDLATERDSSNGKQIPCILEKKISLLLPFVASEVEGFHVSVTNDPEVTVQENEFPPKLGDVLTLQNNNLCQDGESDSSDKEIKLRRKGSSQKWPRNTFQSTNEDICLKETDLEESLELNKSLASKRAAEHSPELVTKRSRGKEATSTFNNGRSVSCLLNPSSETPAHVTRSSEAALKTFNQKSLRNREINYLQPQSSSQSKLN